MTIIWKLFSKGYFFCFLLFYSSSCAKVSHTERPMPLLQCQNYITKYEHFLGLAPISTTEVQDRMGNKNSKKSDVWGLEA